MKTKYFQIKKLSIYSVFGMIALLAASCGSYQSSSYYDRDGIYGSNQGTAQTEPTTRKDYFSAYKTDENTEAFTDVENYNTTYAATPSAAAQEAQVGYGGWGDNTEGVTVNVYGGNWPYWGWNNYWYGSYWGWNSWIGPSWSIGWGWGYPYSYYGWAYPYYGWGWNNCYWGGWNHNHYSHHSYVYNHGRRNYQYNGSRGRNYTAPGTRTYSGTRNNTYTTTGTRNYTPRNTGTRSETTAPRQYNNNNNTYSAPRQTTPTRSYSPSSSGTRSSGGSYSSGSSGSYGGGSRGGGRR